MSLSNFIRKWEYRFDSKSEKFFRQHPLPGFLFIMIGMPLLILLGVFIGTAVIALPMAYLFGWL